MLSTSAKATIGAFAAVLVADGVLIYGTNGEHSFSRGSREHLKVTLAVLATYGLHAWGPEWFRPVDPFRAVGAGAAAVRRAVQPPSTEHLYLR